MKTIDFTVKKINGISVDSQRCFFNVDNITEHYSDVSGDGSECVTLKAGKNKYQSDGGVFLTDFDFSKTFQTKNVRSEIWIDYYIDGGKITQHNGTLDINTDQIVRIVELSATHSEIEDNNGIIYGVMLPVEKLISKFATSSYRDLLLRPTFYCPEDAVAPWTFDGTLKTYKLAQSLTNKTLSMFFDVRPGDVLYGVRSIYHFAAEQAQASLRIKLIQTSIDKATKLLAAKTIFSVTDTQTPEETYGNDVTKTIAEIVVDTDNFIVELYGTTAENAIIYLTGCFLKVKRPL